MSVVDKLKKEPRGFVALLNILCFLLPWFSFNVDVSVMGVSGSDSTSLSGFTSLGQSWLGIILIAISVFIFLLPLFNGKKEYLKMVYIVFPIISIVVMILWSVLLKGAGSESYSDSYSSASTSIKYLLGFWAALVCNIAIVAVTLVKDFNVKSGEDLKNVIKSADVQAFTEQMSNMAKDVGSNLGNNLGIAFVTCPQCGNRVTRGKNFCVKCGAKIEVSAPKEKERSKYRCSQCKKTVSAGIKFCPDCGGAVIEEKPVVHECSQCGKELPETMKFCPDCGGQARVREEPKELRCANCGNVLPEGIKFCPECGTKVEGN